MSEFEVIDVVPTMTVNTLCKQVHGDDRDKQLIVETEDKVVFVDIASIEIYEDNIVLRIVKDKK